jgi:hypothetical protein
MNQLRFDGNWSYNSCRVLRLENELLLVDVLPECGGKIWRLVHKPSGRDLFWQHPRIAPGVWSPGTNYDDTFSGGWDELFPNGGPGTHAGEVYPDHGEYWTRPFDWNVDAEPDRITLHLVAEGAVTPTRMERWLTLTAGSPALKIRYRLTHLGGADLDYLWSLHPALPAVPGARLWVPGETGQIATPGFGRLADQPVDFQWPLAPGRDGKPIDLSRLPGPEESVPGYEMVYVTRLREGWFAVVDPASQIGLGLAFDRDLFQNMWIFQSFGGWRGLRTIVVEPCTGYPVDLGEASRSGRCARLQAGQVVETWATAVAIAGRAEIGRIDREGQLY